MQDSHEQVWWLLPGFRPLQREASEPFPDLHKRAIGDYTTGPQYFTFLGEACAIVDQPFGGLQID